MVGVELDGARAAYDNAPASTRFPLFDVGCGVNNGRIGWRDKQACRAWPIGFQAGPAGSTRTHEMRRTTHQRALEIAPRKLLWFNRIAAPAPLLVSGNYEAVYT